MRALWKEKVEGSGTKNFVDMSGTYGEAKMRRISKKAFIQCCRRKDRRRASEQVTDDDIQKLIISIGQRMYRGEEHLLKGYQRRFRKALLKAGIGIETGVWSGERVKPSVAALGPREDLSEPSKGGSHDDQ